MEFEFEDPLLAACQEEFNNLDPEDRLFMTHYQLAKKTDIHDSQAWKQFLMDSKIS